MAHALISSLWISVSVIEEDFRNDRTGARCFNLP